MTQTPENDRTIKEQEALKKIQGIMEVNIAAQRLGTNGFVLLRFDGECVRCQPLTQGAKVQYEFGATVEGEEPF